MRKLLAATGGSEDELDCGRQEGRPQEPIYDNCSGKHAGMLATCRAHGWPVEGYRRADHPLQQLLLQEVAAAAELDPAEVGTGIDGCGVVAFAVPLERAALAFARLESLDGGDRVADAMRAHPELVGGEGATDTVLMQAHPGTVAKGGADGLLCAGRTRDRSGAQSRGRQLPCTAARARRAGRRPRRAAARFEQVSLNSGTARPAATVSLV